jgi:hypothetical protein
MNDAATQVSSFEAAPERPAFFEVVHAAATAKRVAHILVAHKTELAATLTAPFHDVGQCRITRSAARSHK